MIWIGLIVLGVLAAAALAAPMLFRSRNHGARALAVYRDQLEDVERQARAGEITIIEAAAARAEIGRRALAAAPEAAPARTPLSGLVPLAALAVPLLAGILYLQIGVPRYAPATRLDQDPQAIMRLPPEQRAAAVRAMVEGLAMRMEQDRDNLEGWRRLGRAWATLGENERARVAFARAAELAPNQADVLGDLAMTYGNDIADGQILPPPLVSLARRILEINPADPVGLWFGGLAELEAGNRARARELLTRLVGMMPADSPEARLVRAQIERAGGD